MFDFLFFILFVFRLLEIKENQEEAKLYYCYLLCFLVFSVFLFWLSKQDLKKHKISLELTSLLVVLGFLFSIFDFNLALLKSSQLLSIQRTDFALLGFTVAFLITDFLTNSGNFLAKYQFTFQGIRSLLVFLFSFLLNICLFNFLDLFDFPYLLIFLFSSVILLDYLFFSLFYQRITKFKNILDSLLSKSWILVYLLVFYLLIQEFVRLTANSTKTTFYLLACSFFYIELLKSLKDKYILRKTPKILESPEESSVMGGGDALVLSGIGIFLGPILLTEVLIFSFFLLFLFSLVSKIFFLFVRKKQNFTCQIPFVPIISLVSLFVY